MLKVRVKFLKGFFSLKANWHRLFVLTISRLLSKARARFCTAGEVVTQIARTLKIIPPFAKTTNIIWYHEI